MEDAGRGQEDGRCTDATRVHLPPVPAWHLLLCFVLLLRPLAEWALAMSHEAHVRSPRHRLHGHDGKTGLRWSGRVVWAGLAAAVMAFMRWAASSRARSGEGRRRGSAVLSRTVTRDFREINEPCGDCWRWFSK
jgi:hypothetical protein